jgi:hypothetical protein
MSQSQIHIFFAVFKRTHPFSGNLKALRQLLLSEPGFLARLANHKTQYPGRESHEASCNFYYTLPNVTISAQ